MESQIGLIIWYRLEGKSSVERTRFNRGFLGYVDRSQYGKFSYSREGFMSGIQNVPAMNSLFIIRRGDLEKVKAFCDRYSVDLYVREVILTQSDVEALGL